METKKFRVFVTRRIPEEGLKLIKEKCEVEVYEKDDLIPRKELMQRIRNVDGILCMLSEEIDCEIIESAPQLKVISNYAVGFNNIDVSSATRHGIVVTNTPGVLTDATADLTWALLLAVARRIGEGERLVRSGKFKGWSPLMLLGQDIKQRTLGIVGAGRIGTAVAERSRGWNMNILYYSRHPNTYLEEKLQARYVSLETLLEESDFVSLHVPLTIETRHLINESALKRMKSTAYLINTARGPIVDEKILVKALREKWIAGAGLDVFENEPQLTPGLAKLENVMLTPHLGSATVQTRNEMARIAALNLISVLEGKKPPHPVNPEVFQK